MILINSRKNLKVISEIKTLPHNYFCTTSFRGGTPMLLQLPFVSF